MSTNTINGKRSLAIIVTFLISVLSASQSATALAQSPAASVVYINEYQRSSSQDPLSPDGLGDRVASGSGFFVSSSGYILTNNHVVSDSDAVYTATLGGDQEVPAHVVYRDPSDDLAIMKIGGAGYPTLPLGDSSKLSIGQSIVAIGNPLGKITDYASAGTITTLAAKVTAADGSGTFAEDLSGLIETDAKIYPGVSGGPLLDTNGTVIGVAVASTDDRTAGFAIPINVAKAFITQTGIPIL